MYRNHLSGPPYRGILPQYAQISGPPYHGQILPQYQQIGDVATVEEIQDDSTKRMGLLIGAVALAGLLWFTTHKM